MLTTGYSSDEGEKYYIPMNYNQFTINLQVDCFSESIIFYFDLFTQSTAEIESKTIHQISHFPQSQSLTIQIFKCKLDTSLTQ